MAHVISRVCVVDASCLPACPADAIHPGIREDGHTTAAMLYIDPVRCIDCGACLRACPVGAVRVDDDARPDTAIFARLNAEWYLGSEATTGV